MSDDGKLFPELLSRLRQALVHYFDQSEIHNLDFDLNVDFEELPSAQKSDKARHHTRKTNIQHVRKSSSRNT
ncbi:MAG: hypothetical protein IPJ94_22925 [Chloroflexi bacterium]|nr:hypothetical protein [Chloroflexota bacterium]